MSSATDSEFLTLAGELSMLPRATLRELAVEAQNKDVTPSQLVLRKGLLTAIQVEIVETMMRPEEVIPGYEILGLLGHGGMGVVYKARQLNLDREVALKTVLVSQMGSPAAAARFEKEAVAVARLRHPNVVAAYDFGRHEGRLFFAMEFVEGDDVEGRVAKWGPLPEALAWGIARQAAAGLANAKEQGIVHRDIKPSNLLLVKAPAGFPLPPGMPMVKIADFGLAFLTVEEAESQTRLTRAESTVGSPHYMAPEQLKSSSVDHRADIYALGATVYYMLAGASAFDGMGLSQIFAAKLTGDPPPLNQRAPGVSLESVRLVSDMMAGEPARRIGDYTELLARIDAVCSTVPTMSRMQPIAPFGPQVTHDSQTTSQFARPLAETRELPRSAAELATREMETRDVPRTVEPASRGALPLAQETARPAASNAAPPRRKWGLVVGVLAMVLGVAGGLYLWPLMFPETTKRQANGQEGPPGPRDLVRTGFGFWLFDGSSMDGWSQRSGGWTIAEHEELGNVLEGAGGLIVRDLRDSTDPSRRPPEHFQLVLGTQLHGADAVELHFGVKESGQDPRGGGERYVVRVTPQGVVFGRQEGEEGKLEILSTPHQSKISTDSLHILELERQREDWWISFDRQPLGYLKAPPGAELPQIRLSAQGAGRAAYFSDIRVDELGPQGDGLH